LNIPSKNRNRIEKNMELQMRESHAGPTSAIK
jgi:hypothetical protein